MRTGTRTPGTPSPTQAASTTQASSAEVSTSAGRSKGRSKTFASGGFGVFSCFGLSRSSKKERDGQAGTSTAAATSDARAPTPQPTLQRLPPIRERRSFPAPGTDRRDAEPGENAVLERSASAPQILRRGNPSLSAHLVWPPGSSGIGNRHAPPASGLGDTDIAARQPVATLSPTGSEREAPSVTTTVTVQSDNVGTAEDSLRPVTPEADSTSADSGHSLENEPTSPHSALFETSPRSSHIDSTDTSTRGNVSSHHDASAEFTPVHRPGYVFDEIVEGFDSDSNPTLNRDVNPDGNATPPGGTTPNRDPAAISRDDRPIRMGAPDRNNPADMLLFRHEQKHPNRFSANTDSVLVGVRTMSHPPRPMALRKSGHVLTPVPEPKLPEPGSVDAPPSARPEGGLKQNRKRLALRDISRSLLPNGWLGPKPAAATRVQTTVDELVPTLTNDLEGRLESLFTTGNEEEAHTELAAHLRATLDPSGPGALPHGSGTELPLTHHVMMAERLAQVTGGDARRALEAFEALQQGHFLPFSTVDFGDGSAPVRLDELTPDRASLARPQLDALSVAAKLAASPIGFDTLLRTLQPGLSGERQPHLRRLLEALGKVDAERGATADIVNHVMAARTAMETNQATLAQHVLLIESRALEHVGNDPRAALDAKDKAAIFSWNNGFRERGPGTELAKVQGRLAKMSKYVQRANHLQQLRNVRFDSNAPVRSSAKVIDAKSRIVAMRFQQAIGRKKSPLTGLRRFGANNNLLKHPDEDAKVVDDNTKAAVNLLRERYAKAVANPGEFAVELQDPRSTKLNKTVLHEALLEHWASRFEEGQMRPLGNRLDDEALKTIAERIAARYGVNTEATRGLIENRLRNWAGTKFKGLSLKRQVDRELKLADLQKWARHIGMPLRELTPLGQEVAAGTPPHEARAARGAVAPAPEGEAAAPAAEAASDTPTYAQETEFAAALSKALNVAESSAPRPDDLTPDGLHRFTRKYLLEHPWGNPLTASNGGSAGINTASISLSIHKLAKKVSPVSIVPILDLRLSRSNNAVLNIGSTTHGGEIFIGTTRQTAGSLGGGVTASVGPDALKEVLGQGTASAGITPLASETVKTRGVMVRALRPQKADRSGHDTNAARDELVKFNDLMWSVAKGEHGALTPEQSWELIAGRFVDSQTLSIGWQDQDATTVHHTINGSLGLRIGHSIGKIAHKFASAETERVGGAAGLSVDLTTLGSNRRKEQTGRNKLFRSTYAWRLQTNATLGATLTNPPIPLSHAAGAVTASMASGPTSITRNFALDDRGFSATFRTIVKSGKLSEPFTLREFEERNAKQFVNAMNKPERRAQFVQVFRATYGNEEGEAELDKFLTKVKNWAGAGQHYAARYRMRDEDRNKLDELAAVAHTIHERDPKDPMLANIERAMKARLEDEDSWVPIQTFSLEGQTARAAFGINFGLQFSAQDTVTSDRELSAVVVPLETADRWTRMRRDTPPFDPSAHPREESSEEERRAGA